MEREREREKRERERERERDGVERVREIMNILRKHNQSNVLLQCHKRSYQVTPLFLFMNTQPHTNHSIRQWCMHAHPQRLDGWMHGQTYSSNARTLSG